VYGIAWDDTVGAFEAVEEDPSAEFGTPAYMPALGRLVAKIVHDDPVFVLLTIIARTRSELSIVVDALSHPLLSLRLPFSLHFPLLVHSLVDSRLHYLLLGWLVVLLTPFIRSDRRAFDGWIYGIVVCSSLAPSIMAWPDRVYSFGAEMAILGAAVFFLSGFFEKSSNTMNFRRSESAGLVAVTVLIFVIGAISLNLFALEARASNAQLLWNLEGKADLFLNEVESDSWRVDRHFNHSLPSAERGAEAAKFEQDAVALTRFPHPSVRPFPDASLRIVNVTRLKDKMMLFVESNVELDYAIFVLKAEDRNLVFYRKALQWAPTETYLLIFNTGPLDDALQSFTLNLKSGTSSFSPDPSTPVAAISFSPSAIQ
jgi:hypothetical protein